MTAVKADSRRFKCGLCRSNGYRRPRASRARMLNCGILSLHSTALIYSCEFSSTSSAGKIKQEWGCRRGSGGLKLKRRTGRSDLPEKSNWGQKTTKCSFLPQHCCYCPWARYQTLYWLTAALVIVLSRLQLWLQKETFNMRMDAAETDDTFMFNS